MRRWLPIMLLAPLLAGCPVTQPSPPGDAHLLTEPATGASYWLYVPTTYEDSREWPLVVTLHGSFAWDGPKRQVAEWANLAEQQKFIVAAPRLKSAEGILPVGGNRRMSLMVEDEKRILAIIDELSAKYNIGSVEGKKAVLLTGFSAGGYPLYFVGLRNPQRFHMLIARDCNSSIPIMEQTPLTEEARNLPIYVFWGKDDMKAIQDDSWAAFAWLRNHRFYRAKSKEIRGGHLRRPDVAYQLWSSELPARFRL